MTAYRAPRPRWLDNFLDYPHGGLNEEQAREVTRYVVAIEEHRECIQCAKRRAAESYAKEPKK